MGLATQNQNLSAVWTPEDEKLVIDTICKGANAQEFRLFKAICQRTQLCPFSKQIYAIFRKDKKLNREAMTIQTSIDGLRLVAERSERYSPGKSSEYKFDEKGNLTSATSFVKKYTKDGTWHEISYEAFYCEYVQTFKDYNTGEMVPTKFWKDMPRVMLAKVAEAAALRKAFPQELSGLYIKEEMDQADLVTVDHEEIHQPSKNIQKSDEITYKNNQKLQITHEKIDQGSKTSLENKDLPIVDPIIEAPQLHELLSKLQGTHKKFRANMDKYILETWKIADYDMLTQSQYPTVMHWIQLNLDRQKKELDAKGVA